MNYPRMFCYMFIKVMKHLTQEQIFEYIDGTSQPAESGRIAVHLRECSVCSHEVEQHRAMTSVLKRSPAVEPSPEFSVHLMASIMNEPIPKSKPKVIALKKIKIGWLVAASIIISFGIFIASIPQKQAAVYKPSEIQNVVHSYSDRMVTAMHSVTDFFTAISQFIPVKSSGSLVLLLSGCFLLWVVDRAARKRFLGA